MIRGRSRPPWKVFIKAHLGAIAAMDFFNVEILSLAGLIRYHVLVVLDIQTRRVHIAGIVRHAHGAWMMQVGRNLIDAVDGFLHAPVARQRAGGYLKAVERQEGVA